MHAIVLVAKNYTPALSGKNDLVTVDSDALIDHILYLTMDAATKEGSLVLLYEPYEH